MHGFAVYVKEGLPFVQDMSTLMGLSDCNVDQATGKFNAFSLHKNSTIWIW